MTSLRGLGILFNISRALPKTTQEAHRVFIRSGSLTFKAGDLNHQVFQRSQSIRCSSFSSAPSGSGKKRGRPAGKSSKKESKGESKNETTTSSSSSSASSSSSSYSQRIVLPPYWPAWRHARGLWEGLKSRIIELRGKSTSPPRWGGFPVPIRKEGEEVKRVTSEGLRKALFDEKLAPSKLIPPSINPVISETAGTKSTSRLSALLATAAAFRARASAWRQSRRRKAVESDGGGSGKKGGKGKKRADVVVDGTGVGNGPGRGAKWLAWTLAGGSVVYLTIAVQDLAREAVRGKRREASIPPVGHTPDPRQLTMAQLIPLLRWEDAMFQRDALVSVSKRVETGGSSQVDELVAAKGIEVLADLAKPDLVLVAPETASALVNALEAIAQVRPSLGRRFVSAGGIDLLVFLSHFPAVLGPLEAENAPGVRGWFRSSLLGRYAVNDVTHPARIHPPQLPGYLRSLVGSEGPEVGYHLSLVEPYVDGAEKFQYGMDVDGLVSFWDGGEALREAEVRVNFAALSALRILSGNSVNHRHIVDDGVCQFLGLVVDAGTVLDDVFSTRLIAATIANVALDGRNTVRLVREGWVRRLGEWRGSRDPGIAMHATRGLANIQANSSPLTGLPEYPDSVLPIPRFPAGSKPGSQPEDAIVDIVFIHGIDGGPITTWRRLGGPGEPRFVGSWLNDYLAPDFPRARVLNISYTDVLSNWFGSGVSLLDRTKGLLADLRRARVGEDAPVIFVTHSMGGLIVKGMLAMCEEDPECHRLLQSVRGVVFYSTPHKGSGLADLCFVLQPFVRPTTSVEALRPGAKAVAELNLTFERLVKKNGIEVMSFGETTATGISPGLALTVVPQESANPGIGTFHLVHDTDHMMVCKVPSREDVRYAALSEFIRHLVPELRGDPAVSQPTKVWPRTLFRELSGRMVELRKEGEEIFLKKLGGLQEERVEEQQEDRQGVVVEESE